ncbi:hypothetical protein E8E12_005995 [Didymella heteroderae]|uniref:3-oxoacyl-[acyl-carrier-protein] reductase n=1 Tax=Didymella heteroderae TaxID=1769908 RepID=A0A9P4WUL9_9PLEO|nr:hypothetical protein E8E12_005995 [Didymella heteroderae]
MASLPQQRPASQRRASPAAEASSSQQEDVTRSSSFSAASVDSQTLLLNSSQAHADDKQTEAPQQNTTTAPQEQEDEEPRRCWICFNDETEDDDTTSEWRSPSDMEAPTAGRRAGRKTGKILCPQCKSEIRVERPRSVVVDSVRVVEKLAGTLLLPGFAFVTGTALYSTLTLAGTQTIYAIFGTQDAVQILQPLYQAPTDMPSSLAIRLVDHLRHHWRLDIGLPLIPAILVASRTTLADSFLPFLPLIFFVSSGQPGDEMLQLQWPPSAAFSFAALPYLRGFYNAYYDRVWAPREQRWLKEIQPRAGTEDAAPEGGLEFQLGEVEVDFDIFGDWNNGAAHNHDHDVVEPAQPAEAAHPLHAPPLDNDVQVPDVPAQEAAPAPNVPAQPRRQRVRRERNIAFSTTSLADTILGALIFPSIAAAMGELLRVSLPTSWVTPPKGVVTTSWLGGWLGAGAMQGGKGRPTGFLQTRWGRSLFSDCVRPTVHRLSINHASKSVSMSASKRVDQIAGHLNYPKGMLAGQVAIITGSGQGIGAECARLFANEGAKVIVADVDAKKAEAVVSSIKANGGQAIAVTGDVLDDAYVKTLIQKAAEFGNGKIHIIVNNAGYTWDGVIHKMTDKQWHTIVDLHATAPFKIVRAAAPYFRVKDGEPRNIINISSTSGLHGNAGQINYALAKAGVTGVTKTIAKEWGPNFGVRANTVAFGHIATRLTAAKEAGAFVQLPDGEKVALGIPQKQKQAAGGQEHADIPLRRPGTATEAASAVLAVASPLFSYVNGETIKVTGGRAM